MKNIKNLKKTSFLRKLFIKICRKLGYEIIDQNSFKVVTSNKILTDNLSKLGHNSINIPLGEVKITRKVKALEIIIRTCASEVKDLIKKTRLFEEQKIEYTLRTIRSLLHSVNFAAELKGLKFVLKLLITTLLRKILKKLTKCLKNSMKTMKS